MTKSVRVITYWERFKRLTVWHPINTDPADDDRWTVRVWLPAYDLLAVVAGLIAYNVGSALMNRLFPHWLVDLASITYATAGAITLIGVCIPNLWRIEIAGKIVMSFLLTTYALLVLAFPTPIIAQEVARNNSFVTVILIMATWGIYPRLTKLFMRGYRNKKARKEVVR